MKSILALSALLALSACEAPTAEEQAIAETEAIDYDFDEVCYKGVIYFYETSGMYGASLTAKIDSKTLQPMRCNNV